MKKILVIDDDPGILTAMRYLLEDAGYDVNVTADTSVVDHMTNSTADLVIVDLLLSGKDGKELINKLRARKDLKRIPVIMLSAHPSAAEAAKQAGADDFLAKPFDIEDLYRIIQKHLKN